jgi:NADP-reducing hydrogenase subunit HndB
MREGDNMPAIKSLDDLKKVREDALRMRQMKASAGNTRITVAMGTCGIAAGARDTMKAILEVIEKQNLKDIVVTQTGCIGLCEKEPIIEIELGEKPKVLYGKVSPEVARQIMKEHVQGEKVVQNHVIQK